MTALAEEAFAEFVADCGPDAHQIPASCELYLNQYLGPFPAERDLLLAGLQVGVPRHILKHDGGVGYDDHLSDITDKFAIAADIPRADAQWVVGAWAYAVGRPVGAESVKDENLGRVYEKPVQPKSWEQAIIAAVVVAGGFLGGLIGGAAFPILMLVVDHTQADSVGMGQKTDTTMQILVVLAFMSCVGLWCAVAAWAGWWFGSGREYPWGGFAVAFGSALSTTAILLFVFPLFVKPFILFGAVFGSVYKTAARGGNA